MPWLLSFAYHIALWLYNNCMLMIQQNYNRNTWFIYIGYELYISYCPMLKRVLSITATSVLSIHPKRIPFALPMTNTPGYHFRKVSFYRMCQAVCEGHYRMVPWEKQWWDMEWSTGIGFAKRINVHHTYVKYQSLTTEYRIRALEVVGIAVGYFKLQCVCVLGAGILAYIHWTWSSMSKHRKW